MRPFRIVFAQGQIRQGCPKIDFLGRFLLRLLQHRAGLLGIALAKQHLGTQEHYFELSFGVADLLGILQCPHHPRPIRLDLLCLPEDFQAGDINPDARRDAFLLGYHVILGRGIVQLPQSPSSHGHARQRDHGSGIPLHHSLEGVVHLRGILETLVALPQIDVGLTRQVRLRRHECPRSLEQRCRLPPVAFMNQQPSLHVVARGGDARLTHLFDEANDFRLGRIPVIDRPLLLLGHNALHGQVVQQQIAFVPQQLEFSRVAGVGRLPFHQFQSAAQVFQSLVTVLAQGSPALSVVAQRVFGGRAPSQALQIRRCQQDLDRIRFAPQCLLDNVVRGLLQCQFLTVRSSLADGDEIEITTIAPAGQVGFRGGGIPIHQAVNRSVRFVQVVLSILGAQIVRLSQQVGQSNVERLGVRRVDHRQAVTVRRLSGLLVLFENLSPVAFQFATIRIDPRELLGERQVVLPCRRDQIDGRFQILLVHDALEMIACHLVIAQFQGGFDEQSA